MSNSRDDFNETTRRILHDRVQGRCSNPSCDAPTKGPHTDDAKVTNVGMACHIHAAAPGGARYNPAQTTEERKSHANGIWMCRVCGTLVDNDEERYPADLLREWKRRAETAAQLRLEERTQESLLQYCAEATEELLGWPSTLPDGTWLERPELHQLIEMLQDDEIRPIVLLGPPGSGKSALLARLGWTLRERGIHVVGIKADRLPVEVRSLRDLREHFGTPIGIAETICAVGRTTPTVLVVDQLDALSDLLDVKTERLSVLLTLIADVAGHENIRIVCSARTFDFRHDLRFERLKAREIKLELPTIDSVDGALRAAGHDPGQLPSILRELLRTPQWLKFFLGLGICTREDFPNTWQELLEIVWKRNIVNDRETADACEQAVRSLAGEMAQREELWIPIATLGANAWTCERLVSQGILVLDDRGHRVGFAHQSFYEFARARTFLGKESLVAYVRNSKDSLFTRPTLWTALGYLRAVDRNRYSRELQELWGQDLRRHIRLLLIEFLGQQQDPTDLEASLLLPLLLDAAWHRTAFSATAGSRGWFARLSNGHLKGAMIRGDAFPALETLCSAVRFHRDAALTLVKECWSEDRYAPFVLAVLRSLEEWDDGALKLAAKALDASGDDKDELEQLVWHLQRHKPAYAIRLVAASLERKLDRVLETVVPTQPLSADASDVKRMQWHFYREPRHSLGELLSSASRGHHNLYELAGAEPAVFLSTFLPWLARLLERATEVGASGGSYTEDHLLGSTPTDGLPHELPDGLRVASQRLASACPEGFLAIVEQWTASALMSIHVALSFGLEHLATTHAAAVLEYLLGDPRRLCVRDRLHGREHSVTLVAKLVPQLEPTQVQSLEQAISRVAPAGSRQGQSVESRWYARRVNRMHRYNLLRCLPVSLLSATGRTRVDQESRVFSVAAGTPERAFEVRAIGSPMTAAQMERARDQDIVNLFNELVDATDFAHPRRTMEGGSVQAAREFGAFAKKVPDRAVRIAVQLRPGVQENPVGEMLRSLAETDFPTTELEQIVHVCQQRGFASATFRWDASWSLERRAAGGLSSETIALLVSWLGDEPREPPQEANSERGEPPFLWGFGGGGNLPSGGYPKLAALTTALLSLDPPDAVRWVDILTDHVLRRDAPEVWRMFSMNLQWLRLAPKDKAVRLVDALFCQYPTVLCSAAGVVLLAQISWWLPTDRMFALVRNLQNGEWIHGKRAYGEIVGFLGVRQPVVDWARLAVDQLLVGQCDDEISLGLACSCANLWESAWRNRCTDVLEVLVARGSRALREHVLDSLGTSPQVVDEDSERLLIALSIDAEAFLANSGGRRLDWLSGLVQSFPSAVHGLVDKIIAAVEAPNPTVQLHYFSSTELVNMALTLQRLPGFREQGLALFERLLALGAHGARSALDEVDAWPRFRRAV